MATSPLPWKAQFPEIVQTQPELLARHCAEAGLAEKAVGYCLKAGQQAIARWAMTEAVAQLRKGLDLLSGVPRRTQRTRSRSSICRSCLDTRYGDEGIWRREPGETYARARELCEQLNRPAQLGQVLWGQWVFCHVRAELDQAEHHSEEIRHLGEAQNDVMWTCFGSALQRGSPAHFLASSSMPALTSKMLSPYGTRVSCPSRHRQMIRTCEPDISFPDVALPRLCRPGTVAA